MQDVHSAALHPSGELLLLGCATRLRMYSVLADDIRWRCALRHAWSRSHYGYTLVAHNSCCILWLHSVFITIATVFDKRLRHILSCLLGNPNLH